MIKRTILFPFDKTACQKKNNSSLSVEKSIRKMEGTGSGISFLLGLSAQTL